MTEPAVIPSAKRARQAGEARFPYYSLADAVAVANEIHKRGGMLTSEQLAAYLGHNTTKSGAYLSRIGAARLYGMITKEGGHHMITPLAQQVLFPVYPEQVRQSLVQAFLGVPLFKAIYDMHLGKPLPPPFGMKNLLRTQFKLTPRIADIAYRTLMESADTAGFFEARGRTHLILPSLASRSPTTKAEQEELREAGYESNGDGDDGQTPPAEPPEPPPSGDALKNQYVAALIEIVREKGKRGEADAELMGRIEKLLNI